ncbi:MAG: hypothetical protein JST14_06400 [Bacteroidetes bacterium]|nr:hypothetical protein [Bacteroidota bacterium]
MSKNEIRLRRQRMGSHRTERYRNYGAVLERHEKDMRLKKILRVFVMFLITLIIMVLLIIVIRVENRAKKEAKAGSNTSLKSGVYAD